MLDKSFALAGNLLDSGHYYPKRMLLQYAQKEPENTRRLFIELYSEDKNLIDRIRIFQNSIKEIHKTHIP
jgi:hypothetical protein